MQPRSRASLGLWRAVPTVAALVAASCGWPTPKNLPDAGELVDASVDPRDLVIPQWAEVRDVATNSLPGSTPTRELAMGSGLLVAGRLDGVGWSDFQDPDVLTGAECDSSGTRAPEEPGDYIGDVDVFDLRPLASGWMCGRVLMDDQESAFDLVIHEVDECGVPVGLVDDPETGEPAGLARIGPLLDWGVPVEADKRYAVLLAGFWPNDPEHVVRYGMGLSLVPEADGSVGTLCPKLPPEVEE